MDYNVVNTHAANAINAYKTDTKKFNQSMSGFYTEGKKNPTVAKAIFKENVDTFTKKVSEATSDILKTKSIKFDLVNMADQKARMVISSIMMSKALNVWNMDKDPNLDKIPEKAEFDKKYKELYPRTADVRERFIDANHLKMDKVTPKANYIEKNYAIKTMSELKEMYPKTFKARSILILKGQIQNNNVTKRTQGFFERLSYKGLIEKGFGFAKKAMK